MDAVDLLNSLEVEISADDISAAIIDGGIFESNSFLLGYATVAVWVMENPGNPLSSAPKSIALETLVKFVQEYGGFSLGSARAGVQKYFNLHGRSNSIS